MTKAKTVERAHELKKYKYIICNKKMADYN